jgi:hypothetical protein
MFVLQNMQTWEIVQKFIKFFENMIKNFEKNYVKNFD